MSVIEMDLEKKSDGLWPENYRDKQADLYASSFDYIDKQGIVPFVKQGFKSGWDAAKEELLKEFEWFFCDAYCMNYGNPDYCEKCPVKTKKHWLTGDFKQEYDKKNSNSSNIRKEYNLKPFQKVLCRDHVKNKWTGDFFLYKFEDGKFCCVSFNWVYCIPYNEQTKHLLNTNENWEPQP